MSKKVLIADDDEGILGALTMVLEDEGYEIKIASKGEEIYKNAIIFQPDVILLDMLLSGSDGREICKQLKQEEDTKKIPIIMISAHPSGEKGAVGSGADDFLPKPFERDELLSKIARYIIPL